MGTTREELSSGFLPAPPHRVSITHSFYMGKTEVTQEQWIALMGENPSYFRDCDDCPVESVTWQDALAFCNALSLQEGLTPAYRVDAGEVIWQRDADGYRLPTEAEWEYACRAGTPTAYHTGDCLSADEANFDGYLVDPGCPEGLNRAEPISVASFAPKDSPIHR